MKAKELEDRLANIEKHITDIKIWQHTNELPSNLDALWDEIYELKGIRKEE